MQLKTVTDADVGRVSSADLGVDVLHGRVGIALILRCGLRGREGGSGTMMSCWFIRLPTTISLWWTSSYTGDASRFATVRPKGKVSGPHVFPPSVLFFWQTYIVLSLSIKPMPSIQLSNFIKRIGIAAVTRDHSALRKGDEGMRGSDNRRYANARESTFPRLEHLHTDHSGITAL